MKLTPHPHAAIIKKWADGHLIQYRVNDTGEWVDFDELSPSWSPSCIYRVKPKEPKQIVKYISAPVLSHAPLKMMPTAWTSQQTISDKIKGTWTFNQTLNIYELTSVELIK